jgi:DNA-binding transcriptional regulator LsrR (DeoR family)
MAGSEDGSDDLERLLEAARREHLVDREWYDVDRLYVIERALSATFSLHAAHVIQRAWRTRRARRPLAHLAALAVPKHSISDAHVAEIWHHHRVKYWRGGRANGGVNFVFQR